MKPNWYCMHDGLTYGPFSEAEMNELIAQNALLDSDGVWPEGGEPEDAAPASAIFDFTAFPAETSPLPDWLADIAAPASDGPLPDALPSDDVPVWLDELRLWIDLESPTSTEADAVQPADTEDLPDWMEGWLTAPEVPSPRPPIAPAPPLTPADVQPERRSPPKAAPPAAAAPPTLKNPTLPAPPAMAPPRAEAMPPHQLAIPSLAEKIRQSSGFDLETGKVIDAAKFQKWKREQAHASPAGQPTVSNESLLEVFRKARLAVESWVDDDANRLFVLHGTTDEIKRRPAVQDILRAYANYGQTLHDKLLRHLEFMVENRRKYYNALAGRAS